MQVKSCGAVVFRKKADIPHYLLLKHLSGNHWSLPKGHIEPDETETQTALREIKEETGLKVTLIPGFRVVISYLPSPGTHKEVVFFLAEAPTKNLNLQKSEIINSVWLDLADSLKLASYTNIHQVLQQAQDFLDRDKHPTEKTL